MLFINQSSLLPIQKYSGLGIRSKKDMERPPPGLISKTLKDRYRLGKVANSLKVQRYLPVSYSCKKGSSQFLEEKEDHILQILKNVPYKSEACQEGQVAGDIEGPSGTSCD